LFIIVIALLGHFFEQSPQPTQFSSRRNNVGSASNFPAFIDSVLPSLTSGKTLKFPSFGDESKLLGLLVFAGMMVIDPRGHLLAHPMQARHFEGSCSGFLLTIAMALKGHFLAQNPQPTQFSVCRSNVGSTELTHGAARIACSEVGSVMIVGGSVLPRKAERPTPIMPTTDINSPAQTTCQSELLAVFASAVCGLRTKTSMAWSDSTLPSLTFSKTLYVPSAGKECTSTGLLLSTTVVLWPKSQENTSASLSGSKVFEALNVAGSLTSICGS
jgi:hypothetical protein